MDDKLIIDPWIGYTAESYSTRSRIGVWTRAWMGAYYRSSSGFGVSYSGMFPWSRSGEW